MTITFNPNIDSKELWKAIIENDGYCPLKEKTEENKCICKHFLEQKEGICEYGLYIKK